MNQIKPQSTYTDSRFVTGIGSGCSKLELDFKIPFLGCLFRFSMILFLLIVQVALGMSTLLLSLYTLDTVHL